MIELLNRQRVRRNGVCYLARRLWISSVAPRLIYWLATFFVVTLAVSEWRNDMMLSNAELECCDNLMYSWTRKITIAKVLSKSATIYCIQQSMFVKLYCWRSHWNYCMYIWFNWNIFILQYYITNFTHCIFFSFAKKPL